MDWTHRVKGVITMKIRVKLSDNSKNYDILLEKVETLNKSVVNFRTIAPEDYERYVQIMSKNKKLLIEAQKSREQAEKIQKHISLATNIGKAQFNAFRGVNKIISTLISES